jgi:hypothetical protein
METAEVKKCACPCHKMLGVFLALAGVIGLLGAFAVLSPKMVAIAGSGLLVLAGLKGIFSGMCKCCDAA